MLRSAWSIPTLEQIWWLMAVFALQAIVVSTQEVAVDAYMVDNIAPKERGTGSGRENLYGNPGRSHRIGRPRVCLR